jgi:hypothetical protein
VGETFSATPPLGGAQPGSLFAASHKILNGQNVLIAEARSALFSVGFGQNRLSDSVGQRPSCADLSLPRCSFQCPFWREQTLRLHDPESQMCPQRTPRYLRRAVDNNPKRSFNWERNRIYRICPDTLPALDLAFTVCRRKLVRFWTPQGWTASLISFFNLVE